MTHPDILARVRTFFSTFRYNCRTVSRHKRLLYGAGVISAFVTVMLIAYKHTDSEVLSASVTVTPKPTRPFLKPAFVETTPVASPTPEIVPRSMDQLTACEISFPKTFEHLMLLYRGCLLHKLEKKSKWNELPIAIGSCLGESLWRTLDIHLLQNWDDTKLVILPAQHDSCPKWVRKNFDCVEITLGVGNDIKAEEKLRNLLPSCRFYGADPIGASGKVFKEIGEYFELAVASKAGVLEASVLENNVYQHKNVTAVTFLDFLKNYAKVDHVDYLFMDNEGPEYPFFQQLQPGGDIAKSQISICQISVEMHGPLYEYGMNETLFDELILATVNNTGYLPFWTTYGGYHVRSYYLNVLGDKLTTRNDFWVDRHIMYDHTVFVPDQ